MTTARLTLEDEAATGRFGRLLADAAHPGDLILLSGSLGAGKTSLFRAFLQARAGAAIEVPSPTFTLVEIYDGLVPPVWHADLYRVAEPAEIEELGLDDGLATGIVLVEWPERAAADWIARPGHRLELRLEAPDPGRPGLRLLHLAASGSWEERLPPLANGFTSGPRAS